MARTSVQGFPGDGSLASMAELSEPSGVVVDAKSNVLIADSFNNRVRYLDMATGIITTLIGSGTRGLSDNGTTALVAELNNPVRLTKDALGNLVVADAGNKSHPAGDRRWRGPVGRLEAPPGTWFQS